MAVSLEKSSFASCGSLQSSILGFNMSFLVGQGLLFLWVSKRKKGHQPSIAVSSLIKQFRYVSFGNSNICIIILKFDYFGYWNQTLIASIFSVFSLNPQTVCCSLWVHHSVHLIVLLCPCAMYVCDACYQVTAKRFLLGSCHASLTSEPFFSHPLNYSACLISN